MANSSGQSLAGVTVRLLTRQPFGEANEGGNIRVLAVRDALAAAGAQVDVVVTGEKGVRLADWAKWPRTMSGLAGWAASFASTFALSPRDALWLTPPRAFRRIEDADRSLRADVTVLAYSYGSVYRNAVRGDVVVDLHNIESDLERRYLAALRGKLSARSAVRSFSLSLKVRWLHRIESRLLGNVQGVVVVSETDRLRLREMSVVSTERVPIYVASNGTSDRAFSFSTAKDRNTVVFVGLLGWGPNIDAATWLARQVWPSVEAALPDARLKIVGKSPSGVVRALAGPTISVHPDVPDALAYVGAAHVATAPLLAAGGTRLKIIEALACGVPVIATPLGALGLESLEGPYLKIRESPAEFAEAIVASLSHEAPPADLVRPLVEGYRWASALQPLVDLVAQVGARTSS